MKKRRYAILGISAILGIERYLSWTAHQTETPIQKIPIQSINVSFIKSGTSTKVFSDTHDCNFVVNGSYFGQNKEADFYPAGIWKENGQIIYSRDKHPFDPNLVDTIEIQQNTNHIRFDFDGTYSGNNDSGSIVFNAGPSLIKNGNIEKDILKPISHREQVVPRTIIAKDKDNNNTIIVFKKGATLHQAASWLLKNKFENAINLDGGPSTSITDKTNNQNNFNEFQSLPIIFCIK